ncbi:MAG TPA: hypothetical protein DCY27_06040 [Desulfobacterales bacterium]|nr:hypothetical protein [Desulfobacterales bacterium]
MAKAIGIDLGTTNSVMALQAKGLGIIKNHEGEEVTRSAVSEYEGILVGYPARRHMLQAPRDTIISIKRLMGRAYSDEKVQEAIEKKDFIFYRIVPPEDGTHDSLRVIMGGKPYSPVDISSMILKKIKKDAEEQLMAPVEYAVITVPAYFSEKQKDATREAGYRAGLKVQRLLTEPTAAAIAYGVNNLDPTEAKTILVFDLGGGTLDISIMQVVGSVFAELAVDGDMWLGGDNFDELIVDFALEKVKRKYGIDVNALPISPEKKDRFRIFMRQEAEEAKIMLSSAKKAPIIVTGKLEDAQRNPVDIDVEITRAEFERLIEPLVRASIAKVQAAMDKAGVTAFQIDHVLLVGGSTFIPLVQRMLADIFGKEKLMRNLDPMKCVAQGAAIMAAMLGEVKECPQCSKPNASEADSCQCGYYFPVLGNVTALDYGIQIAGDVFDPIIRAPSVLPSAQPYVEVYETKRDNQRRIKIPIFRGKNDVASHPENELMRIIWLPLPRGLPKGTNVEVALGLSENEILDHIRVRVLDGSGSSLEAFMDQGEGERVQLERGLDDLSRQWQENLKKIDLGAASTLERLYDESIEDVNQGQFPEARKKMGEFEERLAKFADEKEAWKRRAENICKYAEIMMERFGFMIKAEDTYTLNKMIEEVRTAVKTGKEEEAEPKVEQLNKRIDETVPAYFLMVLMVASFRAHEAGKLSEAEALRRAIDRAENAYRRDEVDAFTKVVEEGAKLLGELDIPQVGHDDGLVQRVKSGSF